jgi:hypothetical protein
MYKISYWAHGKKPLVYFEKYHDCRRAYLALRKKYADATIRMEKVVPMSCFHEFMDQTNGEIADYERRL